MINTITQLSLNKQIQDLLCYPDCIPIKIHDINIELFYECGSGNKNGLQCEEYVTRCLKNKMGKEYDSLTNIVGNNFTFQKEINCDNIIWQM